MLPLRLAAEIWVKGGFGFLQDVELGFGFRRSFKFGEL